MGVLRAVGLAFLATWGLAVAAAPASADGPPSEIFGPYHRAPNYDATPGFYDFRWTGYYVGAHLGGAHTQFEATDTIFIPPPVGPEILAFQQDGASVTGGVQAGWQKQWEKFVLGVEFTYGALSFDDTTPSPLFNGEVVRSAELNNIFTLTGHLGYADGRWLAYAKGGFATAHVDVTLRDTVEGTVASSSDWATGWTGGVGIDYALTLNLFLGIEYNYMRLRSDVPQLPIPDTHFSDAAIDIQTVVLRLNYRFGGPGCGGSPPCR